MPAEEGRMSAIGTRMALTMLALLGSGCASTIAAHRPLSDGELAELNERIVARRAQLIVQAEGKAEVHQAEDVRVGRDTTVWRSPQGTAHAARPHSAPTAALQSVSVIGRWRGAAEGLGLGSGAGAVGGGAAGVLINLAAGNREVPGIVMLGFGAAVGALLGCLSGTMIGAAVGHRTAIDFTPPAPPRWQILHQREGGRDR